MFTPITPMPQRTRIHTEREYREWQMALRGIVPMRRRRAAPGLLARVATAVRRTATWSLR